ncbi:MAG TPA: response regulator [Pseudoxanthomonas sp.]|nr:response regulator [Pseudoxanthomonas sp.]
MASPLAGRRILVAEDEYLLAQSMADALQDAGAFVSGPVGDIEDALRLLASPPLPHAAILDMNLGGESVYPVADRLLQEGIPFVFTSGYDRAMTPVRFAHAPHCTKPILPGEVMRAVAGLLSRVP